LVAERRERPRIKFHPSLKIRNADSSSGAGTAWCGRAQAAADNARLGFGTDGQPEAAVGETARAKGDRIMGRKLYVGNLSYGVSSSDLQQLFSGHGTVDTATVISDRESGRSKGFGFVEMSTDEEASAAIAALDGQEHDGRALKVNEARPRAAGGGGRW
jgi:hypothetical protein